MCDTDGIITVVTETAYERCGEAPENRTNVSRETFETLGMVGMIGFAGIVGIAGLFALIQRHLSGPPAQS